MDADQVLAFRLARSGLAERTATTLAAAARCPASDFSHDAAPLALAARTDDLTREAYELAVDDGSLLVAHVIRGAIHALDPRDQALFGRALLARDDDELGAQLGRQVQRLAAEHGFAPTAALDEVARAIDGALDERPLDRTGLHAALRERVGPELLPWCRGCQSHHVAPMMWRYATVLAGARLDSRRRYTKATHELEGDAAPSDAVRRFLRCYGPAKPADFADWAGLAKVHARRLWGEVRDELTEVETKAWLLTGDLAALESPPQAHGVRLLPPGDPYLQKVNRPLLAPEDELRRRLFRPVASPGAVLKDGRLAGLWRAKMKGRTLELTVEKLGGRLTKRDLEDEAQRTAHLRGAQEAVLTL